MRFISTVIFCCATTVGLAQEVNTPVSLNADADNRQIMQHLYQHEMNQTQTGALAVHFPDMTRERAYAIQHDRLAEHSKTDQHVGWKLGWTRYTGPGEALDPIMGHYMSQRVYAEGNTVSTRFFTAGTASAEPEIVFYLKKDLRGPVVTRAEVIDAIDSVGIAMEFVNWRVTEPRTREHAIADNGIAAGVVLGEERFSLDQLDFSSIEGGVTVNGEQSSNGKATSIMNEDPVAAIVWAANELPKWGMYLKAGQFIVSGTVCVPLPVSAGDRAEIQFTGMGSLRANFIQ